MTWEVLVAGLQGDLMVPSCEGISGKSGRFRKEAFLPSEEDGPGGGCLAHRCGSVRRGAV